MDSQAFSAAFLESARTRFTAMKELAERAIAQVDDADLSWSPDPESNSIEVLVRHVTGNLLSRWTDFLTTDGEKPTRDRDGEFVPEPGRSRKELLGRWERAWRTLDDTLRALTPEDLLRNVVIRGETLSAVDAIHRQLAHYGQHVGQIVYLAKHRKGGAWKTLSIPRSAKKS